MKKFVAMWMCLTLAVTGWPRFLAAQEGAAAAGESAPAERLPMTVEQPAGRIEGGLITIKLNDVPLAQAVQMFVDISGANIISSSSQLPDGRVTVNLKDVEWRTALKNILEVHGMTLLEKGLDTTSPVYVVAPRAPDAPEPQFIENFVLRYKRPDSLIDGVKALVGDKGQVLHSGGNMLTILATADVLRNARKLIEEVDLRIPQVVIEAKFVELNDQAIKDLGINWQSLEGYTVALGQPKLEYERKTTRSQLDQDSQAAVGLSQKADTRTTVPDNLTLAGKQSHIGLTDLSISGRNFTEITADPKASSATAKLKPVYDREEKQVVSAILSASEFAVTLSALQQSGGTDVISNPKLIVASGERATIHVGRKDPEIKAVADNNLQGRLTYQRDGWIESGVRLDVRPIVNTPESISVTITPQLSRVVGFTESGDTKVKIPVLSTREITSQFSLPSGRTVAIGGLTETTDREVVKKIPLLGDLPLIGRYLFSHTHKQRVQDEVIIFVTLAVAESNEMDATSGVPADGRLIRARMEPTSDASDVQIRPRESQ